MTLHGLQTSDARHRTGPLVSRAAQWCYELHFRPTTRELGNCRDPTLQLIQSSSADAQPNPVAELGFVIATGCFVDQVDCGELDNCGTMNPHEALGIESLLQRVHRHPDQVLPAGDDEFSVGT